MYYGDIYVNKINSNLNSYTMGCGCKNKQNTQQTVQTQTTQSQINQQNAQNLTSNTNNVQENIKKVIEKYYTKNK